MRLLAVVARFKWTHIDYLHALAERVGLSIAWSGEVHPGAVDQAVKEGLDLRPIGALAVDGRAEVRARLAEVLAATRPDLVHVLYYRHEALVLLARELVGDGLPIVFEIRDPITTLARAAPGTPEWELEAEALAASNGHIVVSRATGDYLERAHGVDLSTALVVPHAFARRNLAPPSPKLSAADGRVHIALVGTADREPGHGRWYGDIIRGLVAQGLVVHTRFHENGRPSRDPYRRLAAELPDYHDEPAIPVRWGTQLADATSRYDLMGVFHDLDAEQHNESATLRICLPTKAVSGWFHGGIPTVCTSHYGGIVERIEEHGIGFVVRSVEDVWRVAADRDAIDRATAACLDVREQFTHEHQAARIEPFYRALLA